ncbi:MAG TPA: hypothetical protein DD671_00605 [Balneolaceae bacterium]|nr:hypothetical protein [Balneola sp.]HBQ58154.1 hypothetical protein [Balneolaceae bacterium]|tara:strand:+ start:32057 stop:32374 length:318 start_codon:yes stop_codon:yes gene_type:complete
MNFKEHISAKVQDENFEFSRHAVDQSILRNISVQEIREVFTKKIEILEKYPNDKYGPSCLILGFTHSDRPIHIQCSYPSRPILKIITLYEPDPKKWISHRERRLS